MNRQFIFQIPDALPGFGFVCIKGQSYCAHTENPVLCLHCIETQNTYYMSKVLGFTLLLSVSPLQWSAVLPGSPVLAATDCSLGHVTRNAHNVLNWGQCLLSQEDKSIFGKKIFASISCYNFSLNINPLFRLNWVIVSLNEKSLNHGSP